MSGVERDQKATFVQPPLQLEESFYDHVEIDALKDYQRQAYESEKPELLEVDVNLASLEAGPNKWEVRLDVRLEPDEDLPLPPYRLGLRAFGHFRVPPGSEDADTARMVAVNGASILFSSMREYLMLITSRGLWGPVTLPTVSFAGLEVEERDGEPSAVQEDDGN